jgi:hypothetical protein
MTWTKLMFLEQKNATILKNYGNVKIILKIYQGDLEDLVKVDVLESNNTSTLRSRGRSKGC